MLAAPQDIGPTSKTWNFKAISRLNDRTACLTPTKGFKPTKVALEKQARNQIKQERPRSRLSTVNLVEMDRRIDNEVPKPMVPALWKHEQHNTEPARFNDYATQWTPLRKTNDLRARNNTEYAYYLGPDPSPPRVKQDYRRLAWTRETQRPSWNNPDPTSGLHYAQPISTTPRVHPEYLQERI